jgi:hypothetical protein
MDSAEYVGMKAFSYCQSLKAVDFPAALRVIGKYAFFGSGLTSVAIPGDGVTIGASAFSGCKSVRSISFSGGGVSVGDNAFFKNVGVSALDLSGVARLGSGAFAYCYGLKSLTVPGSLDQIGQKAFLNCSRLKALEIEDGVGRIGAGAFSGCRSLERVSLPGSLAYIGPDAFQGVAFSDSGGNAMEPGLDLRGHFYSGSGGALRMASGLADGMRFTAGGLRFEVTSAGSLEVSVIGYRGAVTSVPGAVEYGGLELSVTSIADRALYGCTTLVSADLTNVRSVGMKAFAWCTSVREIGFGDGLGSVGAYAFYGLALYDGDTRLQPSPEALAGHHFSGHAHKLWLSP